MRTSPSQFLLVTVLAVLALGQSAFGLPANSPEVQQRRGMTATGTGTVLPVVTLTEPKEGWTSALQISVSGSCSDPTASPIEANINGTRYLLRSFSGQFSRKFPIAPGRNSIAVECRNAAGTGRATASLNAVIPPVPLKTVLTSDTDGVYTDLHIYEPDGTHVYWAKTDSPSGGVFYLNKQGDMFDQPGYGPYLYVHTAPPPGVFRIDTNYWPGGAEQHTLANLDVIIDEGLPSEVHRRVQKPLARPDETITLAYVVIRANHQAPVIFVPGADPEANVPPEVVRYRKEVEPKINQKKNADEYVQLDDEHSLRDSVTLLALAQSRRLSPAWIADQHDCAGLVRFAYRESLKPRTPSQLARLGVPSRLHLPTVSSAARRLFPWYPNIWETGFDPDGRTVYRAFADAETLIGNNFRFKSKTLQDAAPADLLVFQRGLESPDPYHVMIVAQSGRTAVYHNGAEGREAQVRVIPLRDLDHSPDPTWIPQSTNPHFLGVFEWKRFPPKNTIL